MTDSGYSGVVIYTRNATCAPIRAEEGITGVLTPPSSDICFRDLPEDQQIGGYPSATQLSESEVDLVTLDSEGRCVILEFPAFVILGTYCPANSDGTRDDFRLGYLKVIDSRIRNLVSAGKRVIWTGDLNVSAQELDSAAPEESMRKNGMSGEEYCSTPSRRLFNQLLIDGKVFGERDEGREQALMVDLCRKFHKDRKGMFTCWETKVNARPGNYGARIDYVLCSKDMQEWFEDANIQEGLMGSDHCPVYSVIQDKIFIDEQEVHTLDVLNPSGMFQSGNRTMDWSTKNLLPMSGKLIPEFDRRRNIRDMFARKPSLPKTASAVSGPDDAHDDEQLQRVLTASMNEDSPTGSGAESATNASSSSHTTDGRKRPITTASNASSAKKARLIPSTSNGTNSSKGQKSLKGFFAAQAVVAKDVSGAGVAATSRTAAVKDFGTPIELAQRGTSQTVTTKTEGTSPKHSASDASYASPTKILISGNGSVSPAASKQTWGKLFSRPIAPLCDHNEPCKTMLTKKKGENCGRSFWMCNRPLGPSGDKERATQWRCHTFIWASDWTGAAVAAQEKG